MNLEEIWHWFEEQFGISKQDLTYQHRQDVTQAFIKRNVAPQKPLKYLKCITCGSFILHRESEDEKEDTEDLEFKKFYGGFPKYILCPCCGRKIIVGMTPLERSSDNLDEEIQNDV